MVQHPRPGPICRSVCRSADAPMKAGTAAGGCPVAERLAADQLVTVSVVTESGAMVSTSTGQLNQRRAVPPASRGPDPVSLLCAPIGSLRLDSIISPTRAAGLPHRRSPLREVSHVTSVDEGGERVQLNQYRLQDAIGCGSYGVVKLAYNQDDDTIYAMKILNKKKIMQRAGMFVRGRSVPLRKGSGSGAMVNPMERVYREIAVLKKLSHPNVVKLMEVLDDPVQDSLYLVFELLEKGPVLEIPTSSPLSEQLARKYIRDVVLGIEYLHHQKIIHRDIKPANLLLGDDGTVKIADFGVCNEFTGPDAYLTGTSGSPAFMPPEALRAQRDRYGGRGADLWAIGVTLFSLVTGQLPFSDDNIVALYHKIQTEEPAFPPLPPLSDQLCELLRWMLAKDPQRRATLADVKQHSWLTLGGQLPLPSEQDNCRHSVEVTEDEVRGCVRHLPSINTVILMKTMFRNRSFLHPFRAGLDFRTRSNSAPSIVDSPQVPSEDPPPLTPVVESDDS